MGCGQPGRAIQPTTKHFESAIIQTPKDFQKLKQFLPTSKTKLELLYRASRDGKSSFNFHEKCDNQGPTITLCKTNNQVIFGGFNAVQWNSSENWIADDDQKGYLFSFYTNQKYNLIQNSSHAYLGSQNYNPVFGKCYDDQVRYNNHYKIDLWLNDGLVECDSFLGNCYGNNELLLKSDEEKQNELCGQSLFNIDELEVYKVISC